MDDRTVTTVSAGGADTRRTDPPHCTVVMWRAGSGTVARVRGRRHDGAGARSVRCPRTARERLRDNVVITLVAAPPTKLSSSFGGGRRLFRLLGRRWE
jgi:hypothetical protein